VGSFTIDLPLEKEGKKKKPRNRPKGTRFEKEKRKLKSTACCDFGCFAGHHR
jgi:hypothetical protein